MPNRMYLLEDLYLQWITHFAMNVHIRNFQFYLPAVRCLPSKAAQKLTFHCRYNSYNMYHRINFFGTFLIFFGALLLLQICSRCYATIFSCEVYSIYNKGQRFGCKVSSDFGNDWQIRQKHNKILQNLELAKEVSVCSTSR